MRVLFAISALCLLALIGGGFAIRRHILAVAREKEQRANTLKSLQAFEAELHRDLRASHAEKGFFRGTPEDRSSGTSPAPLPPASLAEKAPRSEVELRKPPASIHGGAIERLDWVHFNSDLGDLSDPYQPRRNAGNATNNRR